MSYNIDTWETIQCDLRASSALLDDPLLEDVEYDQLGNPIRLLFGAEDEKTECTMVGDHIHISAFMIRSEGSGTAMERAEEWLLETTGILEAVLVWEGGDSITHLLVHDGKVTNKVIDIPALLRENAELKRRLEPIQ